MQPLVGPKLFEQTCLDCHDGADPLRPDFSRSVAPSIATDGLAAVLRREMPPPDASGDPLGSEQRRAVASWLCERSGRGAAVCDDLLREEFSPRRLRSMNGLMMTIRRNTGGTISPHHEEWLRKFTPATDVRPQLQLTAELMLTLLDACGPPAPPKPAPPPSQGPSAVVPQPSHLTDEQRQLVLRCVTTQLPVSLESPNKPGD